MRKGEEVPIKGHNYGFPLIFPNLGQLECYIPLNGMVLIENKGFYFSKMALLVDTARNKWLKKALSAP